MLPSPLYIERSQVQPKPLSRFFKQVVRHLKIKLMMITSSKLSSSTVFSPLKWWNRPLLVRPGFKWMWCNKAFHIYMDFNQFWATLRRWYLRPKKNSKLNPSFFFDKNGWNWFYQILQRIQDSQKSCQSKYRPDWPCQEYNDQPSLAWTGRTAAVTSRTASESQ